MLLIGKEAGNLHPKKKEMELLTIDILLCFELNDELLSYCQEDKEVKIISCPDLKTQSI